MKGNKLKSNPLIFLILVAFIFTVVGNGGPPHSSNGLNANTAQNVPTGVEIAEVSRGWMKTKVISNESTRWSQTPKIIMDKLGDIHIVWSEGGATDGDVLYRLWNASTGTWRSIEVVSSEQNSSSFIPEVAVDAGGNVHVAWVDSTNYNGAGTDYDIFYKRRNATTGDWTPSVVVSNDSDGYSHGPQIAVDIHSNVHILWHDPMNYNGSGTDRDVFRRIWNATTNTWMTPQVVTRESNSSSGNPSIAMDSNGNLHVIWEEFTGSSDDIFYKYWNATTATWSSAEFIIECQGFVLLSEIAVDKMGHIHVVWREDSAYGSSGSDPDIFYKRWNATTGNWTTTEVVSSASVSPSTQPAITTDDAGNVHVAWRDGTDLDGAGIDDDIFYKYWNVTTGNWTSMELISIEIIFDINSFSWNPTIAVDGTGCVHIAWEDATDYNGAGTDFDIFYKKTLWIPNAPLLAAIMPNPDMDGTIELNWSTVAGATIYYIYRAMEPITGVDGMTPINTSSTTNYTDVITTNGLYYYVVVAGNASGNGSLSNCESVQVIIFTIPGFELYLGLLGLMVLVLLTHHSTKRKPRK